MVKVILFLDRTLKVVTKLSKLAFEQKKFFFNHLLSSTFLTSKPLILKLLI